MIDKNDRLIFHIDVNSAYLSWIAVARLQKGDPVDLRDIVSAVGGDEHSRHGIILAKSSKAKAFKIETGEPIFQAKLKCPELKLVPPDYNLFMAASNAFVDILREYTPSIQRFSIDEAFLDFTGMYNLYPDPLELAVNIKERIKNELGFTVNIGVSNNKLLAKVASDLKKPDMIHTLFPEEIKSKMWPLPVQDLFMVGPKTSVKLRNIGIDTIGKLANYDVDLLKVHLKSHGVLIWQYANGIDSSEVRKSNRVDMKGIGNSTTLPFNIEDPLTAYKVILSLTETIGMRLRNSENLCNLVSIHIKDSEFFTTGKQRKLSFSTNSTIKIYDHACQLFDELWKGQAVRHIGVSVSSLCQANVRQTSLFDDKDIEKTSRLDKCLDSIREKHGSRSVVRACFLHSGVRPLSGGAGNDSYPVMSSIL